MFVNHKPKQEVEDAGIQTSLSLLQPVYSPQFKSMPALRQGKAAGAAQVPPVCRPHPEGMD